MAIITLFSTLAVRKAFDDIVFESFTRETGIEINAVFDPTVQLLRRIEAGETFDVMIGVTSSFDALGPAGVVDLGSRTPIARTGVGIAASPGAALPDISTVDALIATLTTARSVAYSRTGASGIYFADMIEQLGIADQVNARATVIEKGFIAQAVVDGRADIAIQQMSELLFVPEAQIVGPLPAEVQHYTEFAATLAADATNNADARSFLQYLTEATARDAYTQTQLEPVVTA